MMASWVALALGPAMVAAQTGVQAPIAGAPTGAPPVQVYRNAELHLTFSYPAELGPVDGAAVAAVGQRMVYGSTEEAEGPGHPKPDFCKKVFLLGGEGGG